LFTSVVTPLSLMSSELWKHVLLASGKSTDLVGSAYLCFVALAMRWILHFENVVGIDFCDLEQFKGYQC